GHVGPVEPPAAVDERLAAAERRRAARARRAAGARRIRGAAAAGARAAAARAWREGLDLPDRVAVLAGAAGAVHAEVAAGAGQARVVIRAAVAVRHRLDRRPVVSIVRSLELVVLAVRALPVDHDARDRLLRAHVDANPL